METGLVYQKVISNGSRTCEFNQIFVPIGSAAFWTRFSCYKVEDQKYYHDPHSNSSSSHLNPYKCLHRCQRNCTKNLVPLAEDKFIFEMIQGMPTSFFLFELALISSSFADYSTIFNGNVFTIAKAVVCPLDAEDVSK